MNIRIQESIRESIDVKQKILSDEALMSRVQAAADAMVQSLKAGGKVHFCGNGGSAADAQHLAAELSGRFYFDRPPLNAEALHCNTSYLTAVGNDYGYDLVFSRLLRGTAKKGDVIVGISTSGNSKNILEAFKAAKEMGVPLLDKLPLDPDITALVDEGHIEKVPGDILSGAVEFVEKMLEEKK